MTIRSKARLQETAGDLSEKMMKEWARVAEIIKPQITLGKPTRVASVMDSDTLIYCRARCNITAGQLKKLFNLNKLGTNSGTKEENTNFRMLETIRKNFSGSFWTTWLRSNCPLIESKVS